jgi:carboxypeptidase Q
MTVNIRPSGKKIDTHGSSDHASFNKVGVPGLYWDEVGRADYGYGWHTQNDRMELAIPEYLMQSSVSSAIMAYNLACAPDLMPRAIEEPKEEKTPAAESKPEVKEGVREVAPSAR